MKYTEMLNVCKNISSSNASKKVVVVGDYFLDKYVYMKDSETGASLYTGKPAYVIRTTRTSPGAAGTVAKNLANLEIGTVYAVGYVGMMVMVSLWNMISKSLESTRINCLFWNISVLPVTP